MLDEQKDMMYGRVLLYKKHSLTLPERVLIFCDGVSEVHPLSYEQRPTLNKMLKLSYLISLKIR